MGNRDDLLKGAKQCLYEKGYARTTARDIAAVSHVSMASIGYRFGSMEALLNTALLRAADEWGAEFSQATADDDNAGAAPLERFEARWERVIESFSAHRSLLAAHFEGLAQIDHAPEVKKAFAEVMEHSRPGTAEMFRNSASGAPSRAAGAYYQALLTGVMAQWFVDPETAPTAAELAEALREIVAEVTAAGSLHQGTP
jgi:AcrR family transcriptional regulator